MKSSRTSGGFILCGGQGIFAHSRAIALRGKFCSDKSVQDLNPKNTLSAAGAKPGKINPA